MMASGMLMLFMAGKEIRNLISWDIIDVVVSIPSTGLSNVH